MTRLCFLTPASGNRFMTELLEVVAGAVSREGVEATVVEDSYTPWDPETVWVVIPHEFFDQAPRAGTPTERHLQRTIGLCVEHPGTTWFERTCLHACRLGALVDIRRDTVRALRVRGLSAEHLPLGYAPEWDRWGGDESTERPLDVLYMGSAEPRRERILSGYAPTLWTRSTRLLLPSTAPKPEAQPDYVVGAAKHQLMCTARTLLNIHRRGAEGLEWPRVLEAIANGCVVVSEHVADSSPLEPGEHFLSGRAENLARLADGLLEDPVRLARIRRTAYDFVRGDLTMATAAQRLIGLAESLTAQRMSRRSRPQEPMPDPPLLQEALAPGFPPTEMAYVRAALKRIVVELADVRRQLARPAGDTVIDVARTSGIARAAPRVSVGISVFNYEREVIAALDSVVSSDFTDFEVVVVDDHSSDGSLAAVTGYAAKHDSFPIRVLAHETNRGTGAARNTMIQYARGDLVFILDADNCMFPSTLGKLVAALDDDPEAAFAYGMLAVYEGSRAVQLISHRPWDPRRLATGNDIDAMALIRRTVLADLGYSEDPRLAGLEDYDLWCRIAERGGYGVLVPEIVGRYRRSQHSMLSFTLIDTSAAASLMRARAPRVWGDTDGLDPLPTHGGETRLVAAPCRV
jgi:hypothetical protein